MEEAIESRIDRKKLISVLEVLIFLGCLLSIAMMYLRVFLGTDITDESFYIADAIGILNGNLPYVLNNFSIAVGSAFLELPLLKIYSLFVPNYQGVVLFSRICFITFRVICAVFFYFVLKRNIARHHALLFTGCQIPFFASGILNFSYNTVPAVLGGLTALLVFDAVEGSKVKKSSSLLLAGFLSAIAVFGHPGYACEVILFLFLIPVRSEKSERLKNLLFYVIGGITEIIIVFAPLVLQVGWGSLMDGFTAFLGNRFPQEPMSTITVQQKLINIWKIAKKSILILLLSLISSVPFGLLLQDKTKQEKRKYSLLIGLAIAVGLSFGLYSDYFLANEIVYYLGITGAVGIILILLSGLYKQFPLVVYLGIYPILFSFIEVIFVSSSSSVSRFWASLPALFAVLLLLVESKNKIARSIAFVCTIACIILQGLNLYANPYRDAGLKKLTERVNEGVYCGIYTTTERAHDLPQLEKLLNEIVDDDDYFAFRDNVPCGYLMNHNGSVCDISSWDVLQYTYQHNTPAKLFDYYRRRNTIPSVILYVDYGRDKMLSISCLGFRYNDFVKTYYELTDSIVLSGTFRKVLVYRYTGGFSGDYDWWINSYNSIPKNIIPGFHSFFYSLS